jgi:glycosyltransferase involved in cell wall biosynthesis
MNITFVIPVYNERGTLADLVSGITEHIAPHDHTILFIDDGSTDGSLETLRELEAEYPSVEVMPLRGNFGKSAALAAGFAHAGGDVVITMDSDLQDDPKEIPRFIEAFEEGLDVVCGWKRIRHDPWHKVIPSRFYNGFVAWLFDLPIHDVNCGFKLFRAEVVHKIQVYGEMHRLIPVMAHALNYRVGEIEVDHKPRIYGKSKYGIERLWRGAIDVVTMWFLSRHMHAPGHFFGLLGLLQLGCGFTAIVASFVAWFGLGVEPVGASLGAVGLIFGATGTLTISIGLLAELVLRHFVRIDPALYTTDEPDEDANG